MAPFLYLMISKLFVCVACGFHEHLSRREIHRDRCAPERTVGNMLHEQSVVKKAPDMISMASLLMPYGNWLNWVSSKAPVKVGKE